MFHFPWVVEWVTEPFVQCVDIPRRTPVGRSSHQVTQDGSFHEEHAYSGCSTRREEPGQEDAESNRPCCWHQRNGPLQECRQDKDVHQIDAERGIRQGMPEAIPLWM